MQAETIKYLILVDTKKSDILCYYIVWIFNITLVVKLVMHRKQFFTKTESFLLINHIYLINT